MNVIEDSSRITVGIRIDWLLVSPGQGQLSQCDFFRALGSRLKGSGFNYQGLLTSVGCGNNL